MNKNTKYTILYLLLGIINLIFFFDTLLSDKDEKFTFLSFQTNKEINLIVFLVLALALIYGWVRLKYK